MRAMAVALGATLTLTSHLAASQTAVTALVTDAYDGDTLTVEAGIWPDLIWEGSVRILGVDTPEIRGACETEKALAIAARDYILDLLLDESVILADVENDKYGGRVLANVYIWQDEELARVSDLLIANGHAREYHGGTREGWCGGSTDSAVTAAPSDPPPDVPDNDENDANHPLTLYDDNGNGRISCAEARAHGIAPVHSTHPAYPYMTDRDGDGVVCE